MAEKESPGVDEHYCKSCGEIVKEAAEICPHCGVRLKDPPNVEQSGMGTNGKEIQNAPAWGPFAILGLWILFLMAYPGEGGNVGMQALAGLAVIVSLPIIWYDAQQASRAGQLEVGRPIFVVIAVLLLWAVTAPAYAAYRLYQTYS